MQLLKFEIKTNTGDHKLCERGSLINQVDLFPRLRDVEPGGFLRIPAIAPAADHSRNRRPRITGEQEKLG